MGGRSRSNRVLQGTRLLLMPAMPRLWEGGAFRRHALPGLRGWRVSLCSCRQTRSGNAIDACFASSIDRLGQTCGGAGLHSDGNCAACLVSRLAHRWMPFKRLMIVRIRKSTMQLWPWQQLPLLSKIYPAMLIWRGKNFCECNRGREMVTACNAQSRHTSARNG